MTLSRQQRFFPTSCGTFSRRFRCAFRSLRLAVCSGDFLLFSLRLGILRRDRLVFHTVVSVCGARSWTPPLLLDDPPSVSRNSFRALYLSARAVGRSLNDFLVRVLARCSSNFSASVVPRIPLLLHRSSLFPPRFD